jgi:UDP-glucose 4-epimerase
MANRELGWKAELTLDDALRSAWKWQERNTEN